MPKPKKKYVQEAVINTVAGYCTMNPQDIKIEWELKESPLSFDDNRLGFLAISLRGYVRYYSENKNTLLASDVRKSGLTVKQLVDLTYEKVK